jgi:molecular chaperone GrpE
MSESKKMEDPAAADAALAEQHASDQTLDQILAEDDPLTTVTKAMDVLRAENADLKDRLLRSMAETDNIRKRAEREKAEATLYAATNFARDLLGVADTFSRALASVPPEKRESADDMTKTLLEGIEVTERELLNVFERHGIRRIDPLGEKFDPNLHQAMYEVPTASVPPGTVAEVVQSGFAIGNRCLRPAMVGVAKAPPSSANDNTVA